MPYFKKALIKDTYSVFSISKEIFVTVLTFFANRKACDCTPKGVQHGCSTEKIPKVFGATVFLISYDYF